MGNARRVSRWQLAVGILVSATFALHVPAANADLKGHLIETLSVPGPSWTSYDTTTYSNGPLLQGDPAVIEYGGILHVYAISMSGHLIETVPDHLNGSTWNSYNLSAVTGAPPMVGQPSAIIDPWGKPRIYTRSATGRLIETVPDGAAGRAWNSYDLTTYGNGPTIVGDPSAITYGGILHVYAVSSDGHLIEVVADRLNGRNWNTYQLTGAAIQPRLVGRPGVVVDAAGLPRIYTRTATNVLIETFPEPDASGGRPWQSYNLTEYANGPTILGDASPIVLGGILHVYAVSTAGQLVEAVADHLGGRDWNTYNLTSASNGPKLNSSPTALVTSGTPRVYATAISGQIIETIADQRYGRNWNAYTLTSGDTAMGSRPAAILDGSVIRVYSTAPLCPGPRLPDGLPPGVTVPEEACGQTFEFGNCGSRAHSTGGWVCTEPEPDSIATASRHKRTKPKARAAAAYSRYNFSNQETAYWGVGSVTYGSIYWEKSGTFNGAQHQVRQSGTVSRGAHTVRYDFRVEAYRSTSSGWEFRDSDRAIVPAAPSCTRSRTSQPTWYKYHASGYDYFMQTHFKLRDCAVNNPSTPDGTFYSPRYATKVYHCVDSMGSCYFKGY